MTIYYKKNNDKESKIFGVINMKKIDDNLWEIYLDKGYFINIDNRKIISISSNENEE